MHKSKESERRKKRAEEVLMSQLETLQRMLSYLGGISLGGTDGTKDIGNGSNGHINISIYQSVYVL